MGNTDYILIQLQTFIFTFT